MSLNYVRSRISQMLAELILQFSALHFCSSKRGKKEAIKRSNGFAVRRPEDVPQNPVLWGCYVLSKANLMVCHCTLHEPYVLAVS
jgi:hypothetical protein